MDRSRVVTSRRGVSGWFDMDISVKRTGGFAGSSEDLGRLDTAERSAEAQQAEQVVRSIDFFNLAPRSGVGADLFQYEITVRDGGQERTIQFADDGSPEHEPLRELVRLVESSAQERRSRDAD